MPDYNQLQTDVANYLDRGDLTSNIPGFISLAEVRMNRQIKVWWNTRMAKYEVPAALSGEVDFPLPDLFNGIRTLRTNTNPIRSLTYMQPEEMNAKNLENVAGGRAGFYTVLADRLRVAPPPAEGIELQAVYYFVPLPLSPTIVNNQYTTYAYDMLLYGSLLEAKPFIKDTKRIQTWLGFYNQAKEDVINDDEALRWGESVMVMSSDYSDGPSGTRRAMG